MLMAVGPGVAPTFLYSPIRMLYLLLFRMMVVTGNCSRACVHNDCSEYMADPSACRLMTRRLPPAPRAAPVATGMPSPMAPPARCSQSCMGAAWVWG